MILQKMCCFYRLCGLGVCVGMLFEHFIFFVISHIYFYSYSCLAVLLSHALNLAFAKIPIGRHTLYAIVAISAVCVVISVTLRNVLFIGIVVPFEALFVGLLSLILTNILYGMVKFIPVKDERTGLTKRWAVGMFKSLLFSLLYNLKLTCNIQSTSGTWLHMPASHRFDLKARAAVKRCLRTGYVRTL